MPRDDSAMLMLALVEVKAMAMAMAMANKKGIRAGFWATSI